jgi:hypothetical protein
VLAGFGADLVLIDVGAGGVKDALALLDVRLSL